MVLALEQQTLATYVTRLLRRFRQQPSARRILVSWLRDNGLLCGLDNDALQKALGKKKARKDPWDRLLAALEEIVAADGRVESEIFDRNLAAFAKLLQLGETEEELLKLLALYAANGAFETLCDDLVSRRADSSERLLATLLERPQQEIEDLLARGSLQDAGVLLWANCRDYFAYSLDKRVLLALLPPNEGRTAIERALLGAPLTTELTPRDFEQVARARDFVAAILKAASDTREAGINILIYGPPGTGKTAFCTTLAAHLQLQLFAPGEASGAIELNRARRLNALQLSQRLARRRPGSLLLFDEMEDLLGSGRQARGGGYLRVGSKLFMNRLLEQNPVPVLWTTNCLDEFDPAFLRRMTFAFEMKLPPPAVQARQLTRMAAKASIPLASEEAGRICRSLPLSNGVMATALKAAQLAGSGKDDLAFAAEALATAANAGHTPRPDPCLPGDYDPALINPDMDLARLESGLRTPGAPIDVSICLYGPPGTGKSAYLRYLAGRLGLEPLYKRASDLLSKWVGETEARIAGAFAEARESRRFLIIDEADSFLYERLEGGRSWEVSQVNEMLTAMEEHPLPFACSTNLMSRLDPAALRRFTFKVAFRHLTPPQCRAAFRAFFAEEPPAALAKLDRLTPADFALVKKKLRHLAPEAGGAAILGMLEAECALKPGRSRPIGFALPTSTMSRKPD